MEKRYLGDAVYVTVNRNKQLVVTTEDGYRATNIVYMEPAVWRGLIEFAQDVGWPPEAIDSGEMRAIARENERIDAENEALQEERQRIAAAITGVFEKDNLQAELEFYRQAIAKVRAILR